MGARNPHEWTPGPQNVGCFSEASPKSPESAEKCSAISPRHCRGVAMSTESAPGGVPRLKAHKKCRVLRPLVPYTLKNIPALRRGVWGEVRSHPRLEPPCQGGPRSKSPKNQWKSCPQVPHKTKSWRFAQVSGGSPTGAPGWSPPCEGVSPLCT